MDKRDLSNLFRERLKTAPDTLRPEPVGLRRGGRHRPLGAVAAAVRRLDPPAPRRNAAQHRRRVQGVARLAAGPQPGRRRHRRNPRKPGDRGSAPAASTARCWPNGMPRRQAPRSATCRPAFPTCCAPRRWSTTRPASPTAAARRRPARRSTASTTTGGRKPTWKSACRATRWKSSRAAWASGAAFPRPTAAQQLRHMAALLDDLYPTFRLFLYDGRHALFGPLHDLRPVPRRHLCRRHVSGAERHRSRSRR